MIKSTFREVFFLPYCILQATMITVEVVKALLLSVQINGAFDMAAAVLVWIPSVDNSGYDIRLASLLQINKGFVVNVLKEAS